jgi:hypothetical protein
VNLGPQVHVVVQRLDNPKACSQITSEVVRTNLKSLNPRQQKLLEPLLDLDNEMARFVILSRAVMSEKFDHLSVQHDKLQFQHGHFIDRYIAVEGLSFICHVVTALEQL